jgi:undecaprenyl-diphosphatase
MDVLNAVIFGIVEGVTEFLPISSTGHLMLTAHYLGIAQTEFVKSFEITIQSGAILAVAVLYWKILIKRLDIWKKIITAFLPTAVIGAVMYKFIKQFLLNSTGVVILSLFLGGVVLIFFEYFHGMRKYKTLSQPLKLHQGSPESRLWRDEVSCRKNEETAGELFQISYRQALLIGLFQSIAVVPGVSRAAATIVGGLLLGLKRRTIVEFSFLLAIPTMLSAMGFDLIKSAYTFNHEQFSVLAIGFIISFVVALLAIRFLLVFIKKHTFVPFGIYRILVAFVFWLGFR